MFDFVFLYLGVGLRGWFFPFITVVVVVVQEDQLSTVTGENLALKRENEALQLRLKRVRYVRRPPLNLVLCV